MGYCRELSIGYQQNSRGSSAHKMQRRQQKIRKEQWFQVEFAICCNRNPEHSAHRVILHKKWGRAVSVLLTESQLSVKRSGMNVQKKPSIKKAISFLVAYLKNNVFTGTGFTFSFEGSIFTFVGIACDSPLPSFEEQPWAGSSTSLADDIFKTNRNCDPCPIYQEFSGKLSCDY